MLPALKHLFFLFLSALLMLVFLAPQADAATFKPQDTPHQTAESELSDFPLNLDQGNSAHVPEPSALIMFAGGLIGMLISFLRKAYHLTKRGMDIAGSLVALVIFMPVCLLIMILIKLTSRGPILYIQIRVGKGGETFEMYKFRTMRVDAEKESGPVWARTNDNRLIPIGKFLRKSHFDEIPQFINVIKGEMSIIGPRPERPVFVAEFKKVITDYEKRLMVKPGITGLAQVWHRYDETIMDVRKKIKYDLLYIKKMCFTADIQIIFRTISSMLLGGSGLSK